MRLKYDQGYEVAEDVRLDIWEGPCNSGWLKFIEYILYVIILWVTGRARRPKLNAEITVRNQLPGHTTYPVIATFPQQGEGIMRSLWACQKDKNLLYNIVCKL